MSTYRILTAALALAALAACPPSAKNNPAPVTGAAPVAESPDAVLATWNGGKITSKELDEAVGSQLEELDKKRFELRRNALETQVLQTLVKAEASKVNQTEEQWLKAQIDGKVKQPAEEDIKKVFDENQARMPPGSTLEGMRSQIVDFLTQDQKRELARTIFDNLKKTANVQILLKEPPRPRKQVEPKGPSRGPENAKVTIVEFSDFQCPFCSRAHDTVEEVMTAYAGKVRLVFRHFPLDFHQQAPKAAEAASCAGEQQKFWEYHTALFKNQQKLMPEDLKAHASALGLDAAKFNECLDSGRLSKVVQDDIAAGKKVGVTGTPAFFINGVMLSGAQPIEEFKKVIDAELGVVN
jgi:protein-disulfide isomerase